MSQLQRDVVTTLDKFGGTQHYGALAYHLYHKKGYTGIHYRAFKKQLREFLVDSEYFSVEDNVVILINTPPSNHEN